MLFLLCPRQLRARPAFGGGQGEPGHGPEAGIRAWARGSGPWEALGSPGLGLETTLVLQTAVRGCSRHRRPEAPVEGLGCPADPAASSPLPQSGDLCPQASVSPPVRWGESPTCRHEEALAASKGPGLDPVPNRRGPSPISQPLGCPWTPMARPGAALPKSQPQAQARPAPGDCDLDILCCSGHRGHLTRDPGMWRSHPAEGTARDGAS